MAAEYVRLVRTDGRSRNRHPKGSSSVPSGNWSISTRISPHAELPSCYQTAIGKSILADGTALSSNTWIGSTTISSPAVES